MQEFIKTLSPQAEFMMSRAYITEDVKLVDYLKKSHDLPVILVRSNRFAVIDLSELPKDFSYALLLWLVNVNLRRITRGQPMMITYDVVSRCPLWAMAKLPIKLRYPKAPKVVSDRDKEDNIGKLKNK